MALDAVTQSAHGVDDWVWALGTIGEKKSADRSGHAPTLGVSNAQITSNDNENHGT